MFSVGREYKLLGDLLSGSCKMSKLRDYQLTGQPLIDRAKRWRIPIQDTWDGRSYNEEAIRQRIYEAKRATQARVTLWVPVGSALLSTLFATFSSWNSWRATEHSYQAAEYSRKSAQGALLFQMTQTFFYTEPHKKIIRRLEENLPLGKRSKAGPAVSDEDVDDHLGFLDTLGTYVRTKIIDCELAEPLFGHYIESAYESKEIRQYIDTVKKSGAADFDDLTYLYERMKKKCKD